MRLPFKVLIFDLDGTLYVDDAALPQAVATLQQLREQGYLLRFMTNTTSKNQAHLLTRLQQMGFDVQAHELVSAPEAARIYLRKQQQDRPISIWPVVHTAILDDFNEFVINSDQPDFVVLGDIGENWTLPLINRIFTVLQQGARLLALHKNRFWQVNNGLHVDLGLFVAGFEYVTGKPAQIMGKPAIGFFDQVLASAQCLPAQALLIGDDIDSDIGGAQQLGIHAVLVKTGKYRQNYTQLSAIYPKATLESVAQLPDYLARR